MIQAKLISGGAELFASFFHEESNKEVAYQKVDSQADAERLVYFYNRNHMAKTIINWLKQRKYEMMLCDNSDAEIAAFLLQEMKSIQYCTFRIMEKFIKDKITSFKKCIPGPKSKRFKHYNNQIKPLLDFCSK